MKQEIWTEDYTVNTLVLNPRKRLGFLGLLSILQDVAWLHADHLGHSYEDLIRQGAIWVLGRQKLLMTGWPSWGDEITVRTWIRPIDGLFIHRDYEILSGGRKLGEGVASWLTVNVRTRRLMKMTFSGDDLAFRSDGGVLTMTPGRVDPPSGLGELSRFQVRNSDLDVNGHVNNVHYAQWVVDALPADLVRRIEIMGYEANFLSEVNLGDEVTIEGDLPGKDGPVAEPAALSAPVPFVGRRKSDTKPVFSALLQWRALEKAGDGTPGSGDPGLGSFK